MIALDRENRSPNRGPVYQDNELKAAICELQKRIVQIHSEFHRHRALHHKTRQTILNVLASIQSDVKVIESNQAWSIETKATLLQECENDRRQLQKKLENDQIKMRRIFMAARQAILSDLDQIGIYSRDRATLRNSPSGHSTPI